MKAVFLNQKGGAESLTFGDIPKPRPTSGHVLVKIHAAAVTPSEFQWYPTFTTASGSPRPFPIVLGHEFSGIVESIGPDLKLFAVGDEVFGLNDWFANGAQAEYCVAPASSLALKPRTLDYNQAAAVPISALTAGQALHEKADLQSDQTILIHGGAGGVGVFAVQLARSCGARVISTASSANVTFIRSLGATDAIDYHRTRFEDVAKNVDVVFDTVGGETLERSFAVIKPEGKIITVATQSANSTDERIREAFMLVRPDGAQLGQIGKLIDAGKLRVFVEDVFPLAKARDAYARAQQGKMRGKIALSI